MVEELEGSPQDSSEQLGLEELREIWEDYRSLVKSQGWGRLRELGERQVELRKAQIMAMEEKGLGDFIEGLRLKSEARAIKLFLALPEMMVENLEEEMRDARGSAEE